MNNIVLIESPYRNGDRNRNLRYLAWCEYDATTYGENPIASHGNCTAYWPEDEGHRLKGFAWRDAMRAACDHVVYYTDLGMTEGQQLAELRDREAKIRCLRRALPPALFAKFEAGEYPPGSMRRIAYLPFPSEKNSQTDSLSKNDDWTQYRATNSAGGCGCLVLHDSWNDVAILMELKARGYLPLQSNQYTVVHDTNGQLRIERDGLALLLTPT
jgi:hypothetical protein